MLNDLFLTIGSLVVGLAVGIMSTLWFFGMVP